MLRYAPLHRTKLTSVPFRYTVIIITIKLVVLKQLQTRHQASLPLAAFHRASCSPQFQWMYWEMHCCRLGAQAASPPCILAAVLHAGKLLSQESVREEVWRGIALWLHVRESRGLCFRPCPWLWADSSVCSSCMKWLKCLCLLPFSISPLCFLTGTVTAPSMQTLLSISFTVSNCSLLHL